MSALTSHTPFAGQIYMFLLLVSVTALDSKSRVKFEASGDKKLPMRVDGGKMPGSLERGAHRVL